MEEKRQLFTEEEIAKMTKVERELYQKAIAQEPFYTIGEAAIVAHEHNPGVPMERLQNAITRAAVPDRAQILSAYREGHKVLDIKSFYAWLREYQSRAAREEV